MEFTLILVPLLAFLAVKTALDQRATARAQKMKLLEEALKNPAVDRATLEALTFQITGRRAAQQEPRQPRFMAMVLAVGWLALFTGIGVWVLGGVTGDDDAMAGGVLTAIIGFGVVTYPFALRELEARRQPQ